MNGWGQSLQDAFSRYAVLRGGDTPLLAAGFFITKSQDVIRVH
jgi:hypothetical protein